VRVNLLSGVIATMVCVMAHQFSGSAGKYFAAVLGLAVSTTLLSYLGILPAAWVLRRKLPDAVRPYRIPGGTKVVAACAISTVALLVLGAVSLIYPGLLAHVFTGSPADTALTTGWAGQRAAYTLSQLVPLGAFLTMGIGFYLAGRRTLTSSD
jgi:amino acid transporter